MRVASTGGAAAVLAAALLLNGCGSVTSSASPSASGSEKTLVVAQQVEPSSLTPVLLLGTASELVGGILYSYLLTYDTHGNQIPDAATEVPTLANGGISPDGLRITYHLRPGIRWSDGKPLTAQDCVFTWRAIMNPKTNVPDRYGYDKISAVTAPDDRTVVVHLAKPFSPIVDTFLTMQSNYPILPEHNLGMLPDLNRNDVDRPIVGSGPFVLSEWEHGDHLTFVANPTYFRGRPKLDKLIVRFVPDTATIVNELRTHEIDAAPAIDDPTLYDQVSAIQGEKVIVTPSFSIFTMYDNMQRGPTADQHVREAVALGIDVDPMVKRATKGLFDSKDALRGEFASDALPDPTRYNPAEARAILDADGWKTGADGIRVKHGQPLALTLVISAGSPISVSLAAQIKQQLQAIGIDILIRPYNAAMLKAPAAQGGPMLGGRFDLTIAPIYSAAGPFAAQFFICSERAPNGFNISRICNPQIDRLFADIIASNDPARRSRDTMAIERVLGTALPQVPLLQGRVLAVMSSRVHGIVPTPLTPYAGMENWSIDP